VNAEEGEKFHNDMDTLGWDELLHSVIKLKFGKQKAESRKQKAESRKQKAEMGRLLPSSYLTIQYSPSRHRPEFARSALFG
jgi:hypothetical protein